MRPTRARHAKKDAVPRQAGPHGVPYFLLAKIIVHQVHQGGHGFLLIGAVRDQGDGGALHDAQGQDAQQALGIDAAVLLLDPDAALELIGLLNEESRGSGVQTYLVVNSDLLSIQGTALLFYTKLFPASHSKTLFDSDIIITAFSRSVNGVFHNCLGKTAALNNGSLVV